MPRYVILEHDHPHLHWDLMLEWGDELESWRLNEIPESGNAISATHIFRHRNLYLDYEGPLSSSRGKVSRWDVGRYSLIAEKPDEVVVILNGARLQGRVQLRCLSGDEWSFYFQNAGR